MPTLPEPSVLREVLASLEREWSSERQMRYRLEIFGALRDGADPAHLPGGAATGLMNWWEGVAQLARSRDLGRKALYSRYRVICQRWWATLAPHARRERDELGDGAVWEDFEWLAGLMAEMDRRTGKATVDKAMSGSLEDEITYLRGRIRIEEELRTVILAPPEVVPIPPVAVPPTAPTAAQGDET